MSSLTPEPTADRLPIDELRGLFLFEKLDDQQLQRLSECGWVVEVPSGTTFIVEGDPSEVVVVLLGGTIAMSRRVGPDDVEVVRTDQYGVYAGAILSYLKVNEASTSRRVSAASARCGSSSSAGTSSATPCASGSRWRYTCSRGSSSGCATPSRSSASASSCSPWARWPPA